MRLKGMRALVVGLGRTGVAAAKFLSSRDAFVTVTDSRQPEQLSHELEMLKAFPQINYEFGKHRDKSFLDADVIVVSPGVPLSIPPLVRAMKSRRKVMSDFELASYFLKDLPLVVITGTNGKTTTTTLIGKMFEEAGKTVFVGGNIGNSILDLFLESRPIEALVAEVSSFQLETTRNLRPTAALLLNITEDHMERHETFESYAELKAKIFKLAEGSYPAIVNRDDPRCFEIAQTLTQPVYYFSKSPFVGKGVYLEGKEIKIVEEEKSRTLCHLEQWKLKGPHNIENAMASALAATLQGIAVEPIQRALDQFQGLPHRLEFVRRKNFVSFYNDSKSTNVDSLLRSLESFCKPVVLIAGGKDKGTDLTPLVNLVREKVKYLLLVGEAKERFNRVLGHCTRTFILGGMEEAILLAYQLSNSDDVILFSPGCSSFDMFSSYVERGNYFKERVMAL